MEYHVINNEVVLSDIPDFNLSKTFECGQCFRWNTDEAGVYTGIAFGKVLKLRCSGGNIIFTCSAEDFENIWCDYFDFTRNYSDIRNLLCTDNFMKEATSYGTGIRILKQEKWETLCSFIISQNNNIPRIKKIIEVLCYTFGDKIIFENKPYYTFPPAQRLASLSINDLSVLRCGYRTNYILSAAQSIAGNTINLEALKALTPESAKKALMQLHGVGAKVADCTLLFGLHMLDSFPRDVWIERALLKFYDKEFNPQIFSPYAGIAQQYIFYYIRNI